MEDGVDKEGVLVEALHAEVQLVETRYTDDVKVYGRGLGLGDARSNCEASWLKFIPSGYAHVVKGGAPRTPLPDFDAFKASIGIMAVLTSTELL